MKKKSVILLIIVLIVSVFMCSCKKNIDLTNYLSELRSDIYYAEADNMKLKAVYGFTESPKYLDGKINKTNYFITFTFLSETDSNITYKILFEINGVSYQGSFCLSNLNFNNEITFEIKNVPKEFDATISVADKNQKVTFKSALSKECKDYKTALNSISISQPELLSKYYYNEVFNGEISLRLIIENEKYYYYIGLTDNSGKTTAFLIDAISLEVLAIKNIF